METVDILIIVVDHLTTRFNTIGRWWLIVGIVAIGLADVAMTSFINHKDDLAFSFNQLETAARIVDLAAISPSRLPEDPDKFDEIISDLPASSNIRRHTVYARSTKAKFRIERPTHALSASTVAKISVASDCRTVTYPFAGEHYVVQVTDDMGCMMSTTARYGRDRLLAKVITNRRLWRP